jgi:hypothetical protein
MIPLAFIKIENNSHPAMNALAIAGTNQAMSIQGYLIWPAATAPEAGVDERSERPGSDGDVPSGDAAEDLAMEVYGY